MSTDEARSILAGARSIVVLTGAGISAESGVPTFRGPGGLWRNYRPEDLATPQAFHEDPRLVWEWYAWRRGLIAQARPNPGHEALATLERRSPAFTLITQNVDGLHALAGSRAILEIHGNLWRTRCLGCDTVGEDRAMTLDRIPPLCPCGSLLRPDVVWFGEALPEDLLGRSIAAVETCDLMLVIGTSGVVQPAASFADAALSRGVPVVEINLDPTPLSDRATVALQGRSGQILPRLIS
ncbi:MAG TPA: NAD-dependent deacylase [Planctomycetota bacterium]|nr:NAD-dependent deacylase [Planctomycetota bacterium]